VDDREAEEAKRESLIKRRGDEVDAKQTSRNQHVTVAPVWSPEACKLLPKVLSTKRGSPRGRVLAVRRCYLSFR
jgi:hypothetical protein